MLAFVTAIRPYLEVGSFAATILLVAGLLVARSQLNAFHADARVRNERLAKEKAIDAASRYLTDYVRLAAVDFEKSKELKIEPYRGEVENFTCSSLPRKLQVEVAKANLSKNTILPVLNELEVISSLFVTGVADERTGFRIIGRSFCSTVRSHYAVISLLRGDDQAQPYWHNIVELYRLWAPRLAREELGTSADSIARKIAGLPEDRSIAPLGC